MRSDRQIGSGAVLAPRRARHLRAALLFVAVSAGTSLLAAAPALAEHANTPPYTGVPVPPPIGDTYVIPVGSYAGLSAPQGAVVPLPAATPERSSAAMMTVASESGPLALDQGGRSLVTGRDLVTLAGLGVIAAVALAASAGRFRSR